MKKTNTQYFIASPDGFAIRFDAVFDTPKAAWDDFEQWKKGYERQGYYSTVRLSERVKIALEELKEACSLETVNS